MVYETGVKLVCGLTNSALSTIQATVDKIVDAFQAFVAWAINEITRIANLILDTVLDPLINAMDAFYMMVKAASEQIKQDIMNFGVATEEAMQNMIRAFTGDMLLIVLGLSVAVNAVFYAVQGLTVGAGFLISIVVSTIAGIVIQNIIGMALGNYDSTNPQDDTQGPLTNWLESIFLGSGMSQGATETVVGYLDQFWCVIEMIPAMVVAEAGGWKSLRGLAVTIFSIVLGFYAGGDHDARLTALAMVLGGIGIVDSLTDKNILTLDRHVKMLVLVVGGFGITWFGANLMFTVV